MTSIAPGGPPRRSAVSGTASWRLRTLILFPVPLWLSFVPILFILVFGGVNSADAVHSEGWNRVEQGIFTFRFRPEEEKLTLYLLDFAEEAWDRMTEDLGLERSDPIEVIIASSEADLIEATPPRRNVPGWAVGVAFPDENLVVIKSPKLVIGGQPYFERVFIHELAHVALGKAMGSRRIPRWLHEGFAIREAGEWSISRGTLLTRAVLTRSLIPLRDLTSGFPREEMKARLAYAESADFVGYIFDTYGREGFQGVIGAMAGGREFDRAVSQVLGISMDELETDWRRHLSRRYTWVPVITSSLTLWAVASLILVAGYLRKRRTSSAKLELWEREEYEEDGGFIH